jgi:hypothetical protein
LKQKITDNTAPTIIDEGVGFKKGFNLVNRVLGFFYSKNKPKYIGKQVLGEVQKVIKETPVAIPIEKVAKKTHPVSESQRRWAWAAEERGELPEGKAHTWSKRVEGKDLPEKTSAYLNAVTEAAFNDELEKIAVSFGYLWKRVPLMAKAKLNILGLKQGVQEAMGAGSKVNAMNTVNMYAGKPRMSFTGSTYRSPQIAGVNRPRNYTRPGQSGIVAEPQFIEKAAPEGMGIYKHV